MTTPTTDDFPEDVHDTEPEGEPKPAPDADLSGDPIPGDDQEAGDE